MSRKLEEKQRRREAEERKLAEQRSAARKRNLITLALALLVGALVVWLVLGERNATTETVQGVDPESAGCTTLETPEETGSADHRPDGEDIQYSTSPPSSGPHWAGPANTGFFTEEDRPEDERLVHNLEHGQIVFWYSPSAPDSVLDAIESYVSSDQLAMIAVPHADQPEGKTYTITAWGATQSCDEWSADIAGAFREQFQGKGPENVGVPPYDWAGND